MSFITTSLANASKLAAGVADATSALRSTLANKIPSDLNPTPDYSPGQHSITGVIVSPDGARLIGIEIQAFDRDMPSIEQRAGLTPELLGEAISDAEGRFQITYTFDQLQRGEASSPHRGIGRTNADISFRLVDRTGHELKIKSIKALDQEYRADDILFSAPTMLQVSIDFEAPSGPIGGSDYEQLIAFVSPVVRDVPLAELSDGDIAFIYKELKIEADSVAPQQIAWLRRCAWLARETSLPAEAFYGWGRKNVPAGLAELLSIPRSDLLTISEKLTNLPEEALRSSLLAAIDESIVPAMFRGRVNETVRLLRRRGQVRRSVIAQLRDDIRELPLAAYTITTFDIAAGNENRGMYITDKAGMFSFDFYHSRQRPANPLESEFRLDVRSPSGDKLPDGYLKVTLNRPDTEVVHAVVTIPDIDAKTRQQHFSDLMADSSSSMLKHLVQKQGIGTLVDIRRKGGLSSLTGLPKSDASATRKLAAFADLDRISPDLAVSNALLKRKFESVSTIAHTPQPEFVASMGRGDGALNELEAAKLHVAAATQTRLLDNMLVERAVNTANGFRFDGADPPNPPEGGSAPVCNCADCEAAVSPAAYLAALLDYALKHIRRNIAENIDLQFLVDTFHQPFRDLPTDCGAVEKQLLQVRICVEVLRSFLGNRPLGAVAETTLSKAEADVYFSMYVLLLSRIGTSYEEIRRARAETDENRRALAERLGINLTQPRPADVPKDDEQNGDELDQLFLNPGAQPTEDHILTASAIENLFGFPDTSRDPFAEGAKFGDDQTQITRWNLQGVKWNQNTDPEGVVYVKLTAPAAMVFRVELYRDRARTRLVASGETASGVGAVKLVSENNSGLTGVFEIEFNSDTAAIRISAIPRVTSWKYRYLRTLWSSQDDVSDLYSDPTSPTDDSLRLPIIDPDLIGPDDFRNPAPKLKTGDPDRAFDFWLRRRATVDKILADLKTKREANGLIEILQQVLGNPLPDLDGLLLPLTKGGTTEQVSTATKGVKALSLSIESFIRLMALRAKDQLATSDPRNEHLSAAEWSEVYSILAQASKSKLFNTWRAEEKNAAIMLGFEEFWFSLREPQVGESPPVPIAGQPLIDPDIVKLADLPEWLAGKQAIDLWNARKAVIQQIPANLKQELENNGFEQMLRLALGHPAPGDPLQDDLNTLRDDLNSPDSAVRSDATKKIETDLHLTVGSFNRLIVIKAANDQPDPARKPNAAELAEVYALLTPARKIKHEYPQWIQQEATAGLLTWQAVKARLPLWRASIEYRQAWQQALRNRIRQPIIDPWLMGADDLRHVIPGDPAFDLWKSRYDHVVSLHDGLKVAREAEPDALTALGKIVKASLGFDLADLEALDMDRLAGQTIEKRLEQLNLVDSGFAYLMRIDGLATAGQPILESEWDTVYNTLTQAELQREAAVFRAEEQTQGILLGPDSFVIATELSTPLPFLDQFTPRWLSVRQARSDWQDTLQSRIDQQDAIQQGLDTAISAVEQLTLPVLRDALIEVSGAIGSSTEEKGEWITARLLIDARVGGCQMTTRVAQAIETLQTLIFDLRTGQLKQPKDWVVLDAPAIRPGSAPSSGSLTIDGTPDGLLSVVGDDNRIQYILASGVSLPWANVGASISPIPAKSRPVLFCLDRHSGGDAVGEASLFAVGNDGHINITQLSPGSGRDWSPWAAIGTIQVRTNATIAVAATMREELLHAFVVQDDGQVFGNWQDTKWHDWTPIGNSAFRVDPNIHIAAASTANSVYLFAAGNDGKIYKTSVSQNSSDDWAPVDAGGTAGFEPGGQISAKGTAGGNTVVDLIAVGKDGGIYNTTYFELSALWAAWSRQGTLAVSSDSTVAMVGEIDSARLFTIGSDSRVYEKSGLDWAPGLDWTTIGDTIGTASLPVAAIDIAGAVHLYLAKGTQVLTTSQATPGALWELSSLSLTLVAPQFDEEWKWLGSYSTFRAATFVFLYPENILQPSLLRDQTSAFKDLVINTRGQRLNAKTACQYAEEYANYFRDICSLEIEATCQASTVAYTGDGCDRQPFKVPSMFYMFGRAPSGKIYWSAWSASVDDGQGFWQEIPGFSGITKVVRIVGAMHYKRPISQAPQSPYTSYIHVFCIADEADKRTLKLARLDLNDFGIWDKSIIDLPLPPVDAYSAEFVPVQTQSRFIPPSIIIRTQNFYQLYYLRLNGSGTGWDNVNWLQSLFQFLNVGPISSAFLPLQLRAALRVNSDYLWLVASDPQEGYFELTLARLTLGKVPPVAVAFRFDKSDFLGALPGRENVFIGSIPVSSVYVFWRDSSGSFYRRFSSGDSQANPLETLLTDLVNVSPYSGSALTGEQTFVYQGNQNARAYYMHRFFESAGLLVGTATIRAVPRVQAPLSIPTSVPADLQARRQEIVAAFALNADAPPAVLAYLREAYYFVPMHLALGLQSAANYLPALDCFRTVYDYEAPLGPPSQRNIYFGLELDARLPDVTSYQELDGWLLDPLNPHSIAATRRFAYTRFTLMSLVRCMLDFADSEFTQDTAESLATARTLYLTALDLLNLSGLQQKLDVCAQLISQLKIGSGKGIPPEVPAAVGKMLKLLETAPRRVDNLAGTVRQVAGILKGPELWKARLSKARSLITASIDGAPLSPAIGAAVKGRSSVLLDHPHALLLAEPGVDENLQLVSKVVVLKVFDGAGVGVVAQPDVRAIPETARLSLAPDFTPALTFCVPPNPIPNALRLRAELNLFKLRTCRNIAGLKRELNIYSAPTDTKTGLPSIGAGGQLLLPGTVTVLPSLYRYPVLIERAKQLVQLAAQMEAAMLSAIEREDAEKQNLLQAKQQLNLARAGVQLQDLRVSEADDGVKLADLQQERAQIQIDTYDEWIKVGANEYENQMIQAYKDAADFQKEASDTSRNIQIKQSTISSAQLAAELANVTSSGITGILGGVTNFRIDEALFTDLSDATKKAIDATANAQIASINAALERRKDEWQLQKRLAEQDSKIGEQQKKIATDHKQVTAQERVIAGIQSDNAKDMLDFLTNKFTNAELFDWMGNVLEGVYRFFLQQATAMAKLAESQLAFERQEVPPATIMADYWELTSDSNAVGSLDTKGPDRRGLTGSARLLQDIFQLDQYAFATNKRKLSLAKTFSMARLVPAEFQRFRETGILPFSTPMDMFDRGFPGHYLRLIKRVRLSIVALVPAVQGIYATLSTTGPSRVVIGGDTFQTIPIRRAPESIAISAASASSGVVELDAQPDLLLPFEGSGVDMSWEFNMPKAANLFDYRTIADVIMTMEYTALQSPDYRQQVIQSFKPKLTADYPLSFRSQFSDQWYDLHNPEQTATPMTVRYTTRSEDFPPNVDALQIQQILLYFIRSNGTPFEVPVTYLHYTAEREAGTVGGGATSIDGVISTRRGNAGSWTAMIGKSPIGEWELALPNTEEIRNRFKNDEIDDILSVITYSGRTPDWPV